MSEALGITVSPEAESYFLSFLKTLPYPDKVSRSKNGVSAVWEDISYRMCNEIIDFVERMSADQYMYERKSDDGFTELGGDYLIDFGTKTVYLMYGTPIDLKTVMSPNRKRRTYGRKR